MLPEFLGHHRSKAILVAAFVVLVFWPDDRREGPEATDPTALAAVSDSVAPLTTPGETVLAGGTTVYRDDRFVRGQLLVRFDPTLGQEGRAAALQSLNAEIIREYSHTAGLALLRLPRGTPVMEAVTIASSNPAVEAVEPNYVYRAYEYPNDPTLSDYWGLHNTGQNGGLADIDINAPEAWDEVTGAQNVVIGVIDTGISYDHVDLRDNIWTNPGEVAGNGLDDDGNGWIDDIHGIDPVNGDADPRDDHGHGTHVAGTIAARGNNAVGGSGVMWQASVVGCKFLNASGAGSLDAALTCIDYFADLKDAGINVVATNNSWGGGLFSQLLRDAIDTHLSRNILFIAAAGNDSRNTDISPAYPASYDLENIISVAAINRRGELAYFSNYGAESVDIAAPGQDITSTIPGDTWASASGTSMAAPHVAGVAGLLAAHDPRMTAADIKARILETGEPLPHLQDRVSTGMYLRADPTLIDIDQDGMRDSWELAFGLDPNDPSDAAIDIDADGLTNLSEFLENTNPLVADTDGDGLSDGEEVNTTRTDPLKSDTDDDGLSDAEEVNQYGTNPHLADTDGDGLTDGEEVNTHGTDPLAQDSDSDGLPDGWELENGFDPNADQEQGVDTDNDGLSNLLEFQNGTNPHASDTDGDGLSDGDEVFTYGTSPVSTDTDSDVMSDPWEIRYGLDPLSDADALTDLDNDGFLNRTEFLAGSDPSDPASIPPISPWRSVQSDRLRGGNAAMLTDSGNFSLRWDTSVSGLNVRDVVIANQRLMLVRWSDGDNVVESRSLEDGRPVWTAVFPDTYGYSSPALTDDYLVVGRGDFGVGTTVVVLDPTTGDKLGSIPMQNSVAPRSVTPVGNTVVLKDYTDLVRVDAETQQVLWRTALTGDLTYVDVIPAISESRIAMYAGQTLTIMNLITGVMEFEIADPSCVAGGGSNVMFDNAGDVYVLRNGCISKYDLDSRQVAWTVSEAGLIGYISATTDGANLYVATTSGLQALDLQDGSISWTWSGQPVSGDNLVSTASHVFVPTNSGTYAIDSASGTDVWSINNVGRLAISDEGALLITDQTGLIASINIDGDSDADGLPNWWERLYKLNYLDPGDAAIDSDSDGLSNLEEFGIKTNPLLPDTDGDGLSDGDEYLVHNTDPRNVDTDGDGLDDGDEINVYGTNPFLADSDGDEISDGDEVHLYGTNPADPASKPDLLTSYRQSFESGMPFDWTAVPGLSATWQVDSTIASDGLSSLLADSVPAGQTAFVQWRQLFAAGELAFDVRVQTESCCDRLEVLIDDEIVKTIYRSDPVGWERIIIAVPQGQHTIRWAFQNDNSYEDQLDDVRIDNVEFYIPRAFASDTGNILVLSDRELHEFDRNGVRTRLPIPVLTNNYTSDLVVTAEHKIAMVSAPDLIIYDPITGDTSTTFVDGWQDIRSNAFGPLVATRSHILAMNFGGARGILRFELDGTYVDTVMAGTDYVDLALGQDGFLYGLTGYTAELDRIDLASFTVLSTVSVPDSHGIAVDAGGFIYSVTWRNDLQKFDASGALLQSVQTPINGYLQDVAITEDGQIMFGSLFGDVGISNTDLSSVSSFSIRDHTHGGASFVATVHRDGADQDGDGMPDWWELANDLDPANPLDAALDPDLDGLTNAQEFAEATDPAAVDSDGDTLTDGDEVLTYFSNPRRIDGDDDLLSDAQEVLQYGTNPNVADTDGDSLSDGAEVLTYGTNPLSADTDADGIGDGWEVSNGLDPADPADASFDNDTDGLTNLQEFQAGTNIYNADTDGDGLTDGDEVNLALTNPLRDDTDSDGILDGWEVQFGLNPLDLADGNLDSDGDGVINLYEYLGNSDPTSATSKPQSAAWATHQGSVRHDGFVPVELDPASFVHLWTMDVVADDTTPLSHVASSNGRAWVSTQGYFDSQHLVAVDSASGTVSWSRDFGMVNALGPPALANDNVYVQTGGQEDSFVWGLDATSGQQRLQTSFQSQWPRFYGLAPYAGQLYGYAGYYGGVSSFSGSSSATNWFLSLDQYDLYSPAVDDDNVYVYSRSGLSIIDRVGGTLTARVQDPNYDWIGYSANGSPILDRFGNILVRQANRLLYFDVAAEAIQWEDTYTPYVAQGTLGQPAVVGKTIYVTRDGELLELALRSGQVLAQFTPPTPVYGDVVATFKHVFASSDTETYAINIETWQVEWTYAATGKLSLGDDGILYIASTSGDLTAIRLYGDADLDGMPDEWELTYGFDPSDPADRDNDVDGDGLTNFEEYSHRVNPTLSDTDGDGLSDGDEINLHSTNPALADSDRDGLDDGEEIQAYMTNPNSVDSDQDTLSDFDEVVVHQTNPNSADTDGDGTDDPTEIQLGTDPTDPGSFPTPLDDLVETFEDGQVPFGWYQSPGSDASWSVTAGDAAEGSFKLQSREIPDSASASISWLAYMPTGSLQFDANVQSQYCCDHLHFFVNDVEMLGANAQVWIAHSFDLEQGVYEFRWEYRKNASGTSFADAAFIDNVAVVADADHDTMPNAWELTYGLDPNDPSDATGDVDADDLDNQTEFKWGTSPVDDDTDDDGMPDGWELHNGLDPLTNDASGDPDTDGVSNLDEYRNGTNPQRADAPPPPPPPPPPPTSSGGGGGGAVAPLELVLFALLWAYGFTGRRKTRR